MNGETPRKCKYIESYSIYQIYFRKLKPYIRIILIFNGREIFAEVIANITGPNSLGCLTPRLSWVARGDIDINITLKVNINAEFSHFGCHNFIY